MKKKNERKERKKNYSSYNNEKISDNVWVSKFCVTNLTIEIERIEMNEKKERKTVLLIIMKKYPTMAWVSGFCVTKIINFIF